ncbi:MAG: HAD family phosphatase [Bacteroidales bacterium]|jgi:HAD superfamily hydrolase (TIGR01509 family)|nr:HAD family phosphatase [Bacteroidales bacterium]
MSTKKVSAVLFDFDGVVMNTESQYTVFWDKQGIKYLGITDFGMLMKGVTLKEIFQKFFAGRTAEQEQIAKELELFESRIEYSFIPGFCEFIADLKSNNIKTGLVTSSGSVKMQNVYHLYPDFKTFFDIILTAENFLHSKPNPECFMLGMQMLNSEPENTFVFEDSFYGLEAAMRSSAIVAGLTTTNSYAKIVEMAHYIINDFSSMSFEKLVSWRNNRD